MSRVFARTALSLVHIRLRLSSWSADPPVSLAISAISAIGAIRALPACRFRPPSAVTALGVLLIASAATHGGAILHVDALAAPGGDGSSWASAFRFPTDALAAALPATTIKVAAGTYRPDHSSRSPAGSGDQTAAFVLHEGTAFEGGYAGLASANPDQRDPANFVTILSGDLAQNDDGSAVSWADNSRNVVRIVGAASISGFTVTGGNGVPNSPGAGLQAISVPVVIERCRFIGNRASSFGGGAAVTSASAATIRDCEFIGNISTLASGGGLYLHSIDVIEVEGCEFRGNSTGSRGGGAAIGSIAVGSIRNCRFLDNMAGGPGGGIDFYSTPAPIELRGCLFAGNTSLAGGGATVRHSASVVDTIFVDNVASVGGGGLYVIGLGTQSTLVRVVSTAFHNNASGFTSGAIGNSLPVLVHGCAITNNTSVVSGGFELTDAVMRHCTIAGNTPAGGTAGTGGVMLLGSILWGNATAFLGDLSKLQVMHTIVQEGFSGEGNSSDDPLFLGLEVGDIRLLPDSPAIDAGLLSLLPPDVADLDDNGNVLESLPLDILGSPRVLGAAPDLGAVEFTGELPAPPIAEATGIAPGETVVLSPPVDLPWMVTSVSAQFTNLSGMNDQSEASASLEQFGWDIHPGAAGFTEIGAIARLVTSLSDGEHFTQVIIPFDSSGVPGLDVFTVRATTFDDSVNAWRVAPALNAVASPGHGAAIGDWTLVFGSLDDVPPLSAEIGDHGVFYDVLKLRGFAWANVDRAGDFAVGRSQCVFDVGPAEGDGVIDAIDLGLLLAAWGATGGGGGGSAGAADLDGDGVVGPDDLSILLAAWGPCGSGSDQDSGGFDSGSVGGGARGPAVDASWFTLDAREIGLRLAEWPASAR